MTRCIHEIEQDTCTVCRPRPAPSPWADYGPWFPAAYGSDCDGCGGRIEPGDDIRSDGDAGWLCGSCGNVPGDGGGLHTIRVPGGLL